VEFGRYCAKHDVERHLTAPYSLQQNEVVEHGRHGAVHAQELYKKIGVRAQT
jgi:hypothetical protein